MFRRTITLALALLLAAGVSQAATNDGWEVCATGALVQEDSVTKPIRVRAQALCFPYDNSLATGSKTQNLTVTRAQTVRVCFEADSGGAANLSTLDIDICTPNGDYDPLECDTVLAAVLNGTGGGAATQRRCELLSQGQYIMTVTSTAGDTSEITLEAVY